MGSPRTTSRLTALVFTTLAAGAPIFASTQPNVIVLVADDAGYADFGFMDQLTSGQTEFQTPNIDALASQSVVMSQGYVSSPICSTSRAGLMTGMYQQRFGFEAQITNADDPNDGMPAEQTMLTERMQALGYRTGVFGKWHLGTHESKQPQNQGVDEFYGIWGGSRNYHGIEDRRDQYIRRGSAQIAWNTEPSFNNIDPDPTTGRHLTDAIGDEASSFVAAHANGAQPFFAYVPFTAPHSPYSNAKTQDLAVFDSTSLTGHRKTSAALTYAMDRAVGNILNRVRDPNGDGDTSDSIEDNTIIIFTNDNGGANSGAHDNGPLVGWKGDSFEGGVRVPFLVKAPGVEPGVFDQAVSTLDIFATAEAAAGASPSQGLDGKNLLPYLSGEQTGSVHDALFWRNGGSNTFTVLKDGWKLGRNAWDANVSLYQLASDGSGEDVDLSAAYPEKVTELSQAYIDWEVTLYKPVYASPNSTFNRFDVFRQRNELSTAFRWKWGQGWRNESNPTQTATLNRMDATANTVLVFGADAPNGFTSDNNRPRVASYGGVPGLEEFIVNELRFDREFTGTQDRSGKLQGYSVMLVRSLDGRVPQLTLDWSSASENNFAFHIDMDLVAYDDFEIRGDTNQPFFINGDIRSLHHKSGLAKYGLSTVTLTGHNQYTGGTDIHEGSVKIDGGGSLDGSEYVHIHAGGSLELTDGEIITPSIESSGAFIASGGSVVTNQLIGNFSIDAASLAAGDESNQIAVNGDLSLGADATLLVTLNAGSGSAPESDLVTATGQVVLEGASLEVAISPEYSPSAGDLMQFVSAAGGLEGAFTTPSLPALPTNLNWQTLYTPVGVFLAVAPALAGDYNADGTVDAADYTAWRDAFGEAGMSLNADGNGDGVVDQADYQVWVANFGATVSPSSAENVPEPHAIAVGLLALTAAARRRRLP